MALAQERNTRDLILDAMDGLMARYGFRKTTVDDVAREARVSRRTIYTYFSSKEELGLASIERVVQGAQALMEQELAKPDTAEARLRRMLTARVMARVEAVQEYHVSLDELFEAVRPEYMSRRAYFFERERALIMSALEMGVEEGAFEVRNVQSIASSLLLATNAFLPYSLSVRELGTQATIRARLEAMIDLLMRGLKPAT
ncbi:MAG TPA: helix-turn-helix domain-containing protein [Fimbriimonadaceae bacterium]|nr:helix-turn-helix domain-containing protein [Fimbriimonadaceae bacterium]